ncbi:uncharacterized protein APUU_20188A [Aspergillus puulaauensis]|uniref:Uncharacterized protein n=1 Tax=Aspergillus puulaauensis TaxID=1220207 RepID=A0A7R7XE48_9EURO|nr:uncharacterized protein APUU_20188A [Aspergillus puulaauensis]BCS19756.1 hypothetical protein APUU_20188A [Aspergillus puulaauensis]
MGLYYDIDSIKREEAKTEQLDDILTPHHNPVHPQSAPTTHFPTPIVGSHAPGFMLHQTNHCNGPLCWNSTGGEVIEVMSICRLVWVRLTEPDCSASLHHGVTYGEMAALRNGETVMRGNVGDRVPGLWTDSRGVLYTGMGTVYGVSDRVLVPILRCPGGCDWQVLRPSVEL